MHSDLFINEKALTTFDGTIVDCRFSLADGEAGAEAYGRGHIPGAVFLDLNRDMSAPVAAHGGRHPLPTPQDFVATLAQKGLQPDRPVVLYDDSAYVFAARCWWMLRGLGFLQVRFLRGGYRAWLEAGGEQEVEAAIPRPCDEWAVESRWPRCISREEIAPLQAAGAALVDAREEARYLGENEPIDPIAGHIPGAVNRPWQSFSDASGEFLDEQALRDLWGNLVERDPLIVYCGSGVSACVNLLALALIGRDDALLYGGSWSDWCSYL